MSSLKSKVNKLDVDKLEPVPVDFIKLSDVAEKEVAKKMYGMNWLKKFYAIDSLILVLIMLLKKIQNVIDTVTKKKIMMQKYRKLRTNILLLLIITNLRMIYLMER